MSALSPCGSLPTGGRGLRLSLPSLRRIKLPIGYNSNPGPIALLPWEGKKMRKKATCGSHIYFSSPSCPGRIEISTMCQCTFRLQLIQLLLYLQVRETLCHENKSFHSTVCLTKPDARFTAFSPPLHPSSESDRIAIVRRLSGSLGVTVMSGTDTQLRCSTFFRPL